MNTCRSKKRNGEPCTLPATQGSAWCWNHDPNRAEERSRNVSRAASAKHSSVAQDMRDVVWNIVKLMMEGRLNTKASYNMNRIIQLLQTFLRAAEIELASGKEPERGNVLPPGMLEKLQQYIANEDGEEIETQVRLSEWCPLQRDSSQEENCLSRSPKIGSDGSRRRLTRSSGLNRPDDEGIGAPAHVGVVAPVGQDKRTEGTP